MRRVRGVTRGRVRRRRRRTKHLSCTPRTYRERIQSESPANPEWCFRGQPTYAVPLITYARAINRPCYATKTEDECVAQSMLGRFPAAMTLRCLPILMALMLAGCPAVDTRELNFTRNKPGIGDLIGTWTPNKESIQLIRTEGKYSAAHPKVILRADGTYSFVEMPDWWSSATGESTGTTETFDGSWKLQERKSPWTVWEIQLQAPKNVCSIHLYRQKPPYCLFVGVGDPNDARAMIFDHQDNK